MLDRFHGIGLILVVFFAVVWSFSLVDSYVASELRITRLVLSLTAIATALLLGLYLDKMWKRFERGRIIEQGFLEIRAINVWHPLILFILILCVIPATYALSRLGMEKIAVAVWVSYGFWVSLFIVFIVHVITGKIKVDARGITYWTTSMWRYFDWEDIEKARMRWNGKLLVLGIDDMYILPKPSEYSKAITKFRPNPSEHASDVCEGKACSYERV